VDCLDEPDSANAAFFDLVLFSQNTWHAACRAVADCPDGNRPQLIILVNDWQFLVPKDPEKRRRESLAASLRREYYNRVPTLPLLHMRTMASCGLPTEQILPASQKHWMFSESGLRQKLAATIRALMKEEPAAKRLGLYKHFDGKWQPIVCAQSEDGTRYPLLYCGNSNCAGEVVELLRDLYTRQVRHFVNVFPAQCKVPVETGTEIARQLFGLDGMTVANIAVGPC
jgi:hypothetical protein